MSDETTPQTGVLSDTTAHYIIGIHQSYIESAATLSLYLLSSQKSGKGITFTKAFQFFYRDFFRLYNVTADIPSVTNLSKKPEIEEWFSQSKGVLDNLNKDRKLVYDYADKGLKLGREWISQLYNKQVIAILK